MLFTTLFLACLAGSVVGQTITVNTTTGRLQGFQQSGVISFKGIRFGKAPTGSLRWQPPVAFTSTATQNATKLGPACIQQFAVATATMIENIFNTPAPPESEDCLFLNLWAPPIVAGAKKPVVIWVYGGSLAFGTASMPLYDGTSFASNQNVIFVSFNYRTNVFGFPGSPDVLLTANNLGFLDQDLAFQWVQKNIANFGGDPTQVTLMGESAGSQSVSYALARHPTNPPFRAAIMLSGAAVSAVAVPNFVPFNDFAVAMGCGLFVPGLFRLACLQTVSASTIRAFANGPVGGALAFRPVVDEVTVFDDPLERIRAGLTARVPILIGNLQDDGTLFTVGETDLAAFLVTSFGVASSATPPNLVRSLYPGLNDSQVIAASFRDIIFTCPAELWTAAYFDSGISSVFRYEYGAIFSDNQPFIGAGAWHSSELPELLGNFNPNTASAAEVTLSKTFQTAFANFIKNPTASPAQNWPKYVPGSSTMALAKIAYNGNVQPSNFIQPAQSNMADGPCDQLWNQFLDVPLA